MTDSRLRGAGKRPLLSANGGRRAWRSAAHDPLDASSLLAVVKFAAQFDVPSAVRAAFTQRNDVVELEPLARSAVDTTPLVASPDLVSHVLGDWLPVAAANSGRRPTPNLRFRPVALETRLHPYRIPLRDSFEHRLWLNVCRAHDHRVRCGLVHPGFLAQHINQAATFIVLSDARERDRELARPVSRGCLRYSLGLCRFALRLRGLASFRVPPSDQVSDQLNGAEDQHSPDRQTDQRVHRRPIVKPKRPDGRAGLGLFAGWGKGVSPVRAVVGCMPGLHAISSAPRSILETGWWGCARSVGMSYAQAAEIANVGRRTIGRMMEDPLFRAELDERRRNVAKQSVASLASAVPASIAALEEQLTHRDPYVAQKAALGVFTIWARVRESETFEDRLAELEQRAREKSYVDYS